MNLCLLISLCFFWVNKIERKWTGALGNWFSYYFPGFTANLASFNTLGKCEKSSLSFEKGIIYTPGLIRVTQYYQRCNCMSCSLVHPFTCVFRRDGFFSWNGLSMARRPFLQATQAVKIMFEIDKKSSLKINFRN